MDDDIPVVTGTKSPLRPVVDTEHALAECIDSMAGGTGPISVDTERAQAFRYSAKAYLVQIRRAGAGTWLIDPVAFETPGQRADLSQLAAAMNDEWVLHAASQDLPCLAEIKMVPEKLFDTELAARLLGLPRVGLGALVELILHRRLLKEYSAVDWSTRPLPSEWLVYAALDVELLVDLKDWLTEQLKLAGKLDWAQQEFSHVLKTYTAPATPREDPWRRTSGIHHLHAPRGLAVVAQLWSARDGLARKLDKAPSKLLPDRLIIEIAELVNEQGRMPNRNDVLALVNMRRRQYLRHVHVWETALEKAVALPRNQLPRRTRPLDGPPPVRSWESRDPAAYARWNAARPAVVSLAETLHVPVENLVSPDILRRVLWESPPPQWCDALQTLHARQWQACLVGPVLQAAIAGTRDELPPR